MNSLLYTVELDSGIEHNDRVELERNVSFQK